MGCDLIELTREGRPWHVREGEHYIFHLEPPLASDPEVARLLAETEARYLRIARLLDRDPDDVKARERFVKTNFRLYAEGSVADSAFARAHRSIAYGTASPSGVTFAKRNLRWDEVVDQMTHEEIHAVWSADSGEAPSLLNEGVAVWYETALSARAVDRRRELRESWRSVVSDAGCSLRELSRNDAFWEAYARGEPVYSVGAALAGYLVRAHGLPALRRIFLSTHYEDQGLADVIERVTGREMAVIERGVGAWTQCSDAS